MKIKICVVTSSRADYGLLYWVMKEIKSKRHLELMLVVSGAHLSKKYGYTVSEIIEDGFSNFKKIKLSDYDTSPYGIAKTSGQIVDKFANYFKNKKIDLLVLLGDRFEMLSVALAALPYNIPIAHIGGGEIAEGAIDDNIRHCLTKLSHLHFPITLECAKRIVQMGEEAWRVNVVGSPRLDAKNIKFKSKKELSKKYGLDFKGKIALVVYHPVTLEVKNTKYQIDNLLKAVEFINIETIMFYPNQDTCSDIIIDKIESFAKNRKNIKLFKPLKRNDYYSMLKVVDVLIGNSSIGIIEAPSFKLPAVNIGNRQRGRDHTKNIINVDYSWQDIVKGIKKGLYDEEFIQSLKDLENPYGDGKASKKVVNIISNIDFDNFNIVKKNNLN